MTDCAYLYAIWSGNDGVAHAAAIERHFGVRLRASESSYYASVIYRWGPTKNQSRWFRRAEPDEISAIQLFQNCGNDNDGCDDVDDEPIIDGHSMNDWVVIVEMVASGPVKPVQGFLATRGYLIEK